MDERPRPLPHQTRTAHVCDIHQQTYPSNLQSKSKRFKLGTHRSAGGAEMTNETIQLAIAAGMVVAMMLIWNKYGF